MNRLPHDHNKVHDPMLPLKKKTLAILLGLTVLFSLAAYLLIRAGSVRQVASPTPNAAARPESAVSESAIPLPSMPAPQAPAEQRARPAVERILFAGDSMMQGIAPLMIRKLKATHPDWLLRNESQESTGLTVKRRLDWVEKIKQEIVQHRLSTVVVFLGPNDPWDIYERKQVVRFPSPEWEALYRARVSEICEFAKENKVHLIWIGLPGMKEKRAQRGAIVQNPIFRDTMKQYGFDFVSTEALIGRVDEPYVRHAIDTSGKKINLRADDGIHFSPQGLQLIASAVLETIDPADKH